MKRRLGRAANHDVTELEKLDARRAFRNAIVGKIGIGILQVDGKPVTRRLFSAISSQSASAYFRVAPVKKSLLVRSRAIELRDEDARDSSFIALRLR